MLEIKCRSSISCLASAVYSSARAALLAKSNAADLDVGDIRRQGPGIQLGWVDGYHALHALCQHRRPSAGRGACARRGYATKYPSVGLP